MGLVAKRRWGWLCVGLLALPACGSNGDGGPISPDAGGTAGAAALDSGTAGMGGQLAGGAGGVTGAGATGGSPDAGGSAGRGGAAGAAGSGGAAGAAGAGNACSDPGPEPNNTEPLASPACGMAPCNVTDCDSSGSTGYGGPLAPATGVIGSGDIDYLRFHGEDKIGFCKVDPMVSTLDQGYRLCAFVACDISATHFIGCNQGTHATSPNGLNGCCVAAPGTVELNYNCTSTATYTDSATIYLRVDQASACVPYTVNYHF